MAQGRNCSRSGKRRFHRRPPGWRWTRTVEHLGEGDEDREGLFIVTTRVIWSHGNNQGREEVSQYLFVPKNVDGKYTLKPKTL